MPRPTQVERGQMWRIGGTEYLVMRRAGPGKFVVLSFPQRSILTITQRDILADGTEFVGDRPLPPLTEDESRTCAACHGDIGEGIHQLNHVCRSCRRNGVFQCPWCLVVGNSIRGQRPAHIRGDCMGSMPHQCSGCGNRTEFRNIIVRSGRRVAFRLPRRFLCAQCIGNGNTFCRRCHANVVNMERQRGGPRSSREDGRHVRAEGVRIPRRIEQLCGHCRPQTGAIWSHKTAIGGAPYFLTNSYRTFSVEVEVYKDREKVKKETPTPHDWESGHDGSIRTPRGIEQGAAVEFKSPPMVGDNGLETMRRDIISLRRSGFRANRSCGLHVHVGAEELTREQRLFVKRFCSWYEQDIYALVSPARRTNEYCWSLLSPSPRGGRYCWLNSEDAWHKYGTIEFRLHHGITNGRRATEWVRLCLAIVEAGLRLGYRREKPNLSLFEALRLDPEQTRYWNIVKTKMAAFTAAAAAARAA